MTNATPEAFPRLTDDEVQAYVEHRRRYRLFDGRDEATYIEDVQSEHQYQQHCTAIQESIETGQLQAGIGHFTMAVTLYPLHRTVFEPPVPSK